MTERLLSPRAPPPSAGASGPIEPGQWVRNPLRPEWGIGQVQSAIGNRVTVNFEQIGKILVNMASVPLEIIAEDTP
jgi:hypothetical protein